MICLKTFSVVQQNTVQPLFKETAVTTWSSITKLTKRDVGVTKKQSVKIKPSITTDLNICEVFTAIDCLRRSK